jgi:hypothetical protein
MQGMVAWIEAMLKHEYIDIMNASGKTPLSIVVEYADAAIFNIFVQKKGINAQYKVEI